MRIGYLDGTRLKHAILAGTRLVVRMQENLNRINVFPVPDGDTGTNMALTLQSIADAAVHCGQRSVHAISLALAESALMGARGNSGAILAQFFQGLAEGLKNKWRVSTTGFATAVKRAVERAYEAMADPKEGTILTVIKDWAAHIQRGSHKTLDFADLLRQALQEAKRSLADTPKKLEVLARAKVVDAGAQGFVHLLEGISHFIESGKLADVKQPGVSESVPAAVMEKLPQTIPFQFCTECLLSGENIDKKALKEHLSGWGDSVIVAGSQNLARVHIHTNEPQEVLDRAGKFGTILQRKIDNMWQQHLETVGEAATEPIALVTDSTCDLPAELMAKYHIHTVPVRISFGSEEFIDKVTLTPLEFYHKLRTSKVHPTTSQPSPNNFKELYQRLAKQYQHIISIHLPRRVSGTIQTAEMAAKGIEGTNIHIVDGKHISVALGLVVLETARAIAKGLSPDEVIEQAQRMAERVKIFIAVPTLKYAVRGGRVSKLKGVMARLLNLKPILTFTSEGTLTPAAKTIGGMKALKKVMKLVENNATHLKRLRFAIAHADALDKAHWLAHQLREKFGVAEVMIMDASPALGVHAGPGTAGVAFWGE